MGIPELVIVLFVFPLILALIALPIIALVDILRNEFTGNNKIVWLLVVLFIPILGVILYFTMGSKTKVKRATSQLS